MARTSSVVRPLHATRRRRTSRISRASPLEASRSGDAPVPPSAIPSAIVQAIADATDGLDPVALRAELPPEVVDIGVHGVRRDGHAEGPGLVQQLVAAQRLARMAEERLQQRELARAEVDAGRTNGHRPGRLVEDDGAGDE